jgi:hypothetical protein
MRVQSWAFIGALFLCLIVSTACTNSRSSADTSHHPEPLGTRSSPPSTDEPSAIHRTTVRSPITIPQPTTPRPTTGPAHAALPPCAPPPFTSLETGNQRVNLWAEADRHASVNRTIKLRPGQTALIDLGPGCDSAADFSSSGDAKIIDHLDAPPPDSGWNQALTAAPQPAPER